MDAEQQRRIAINESRFREVSQRLADGVEQLREVVRPDHIIVAGEEQIAVFDDYWIIAKTGLGAKVSDELA